MAARGYSNSTNQGQLVPCTHMEPSYSRGVYQRDEATLPQGSMPSPEDLFALSTEAGFPSDDLPKDNAAGRQELAGEMPLAGRYWQGKCCWQAGAGRGNGSFSIKREQFPARWLNSQLGRILVPLHFRI